MGVFCFSNTYATSTFGWKRTTWCTSKNIKLSSSRTPIKALMHHINQNHDLNAPDFEASGHRVSEIQQNLTRCRTANDQPDLMGRVFHAKLAELKRDITNNEIFGNINVYVYTIEFQKCGLPYTQILILLLEDYKFQTADDISNVIRTYLPHPETERQLHAAVSSHMIHEPCGPLNLNNV
ncbi:Helitron helicase-like domain [Cinara cedri]|uniref:Helitron helicase-like domain n=1 Tax=Cinara cedri TaxID=506608 RepID=A0A5E4NMS6_9HEMI|nr:Helitron helicase-like domain [Cinara cedri]